MFKVQIDTDTSPFLVRTPHGYDLDPQNRELVRALRRIADDLDSGMRAGHVTDSNGDICGHYQLLEDINGQISPAGKR